ncbi:hypothetical protein Mgra_00001841 [Meloidogyne graminicola]|uniref:C2H2-type domain-containing protein n=1 Tax=Meloidogyne graminicola TaxID=189291 RepID=A0A8S9ZZQ7_9BILA|nr:hypothetical protein Mgra_00001841 [Meloidogyne graminicola]
MMDPTKIPSPSSPSYPTSDLGSSPRSSISTTHYSTLGISSANWNAFRDIAYNGSNLRSTTCIDDESSDYGGGGNGNGNQNNNNNEDKTDTHRFLLSPQLLLSPLLSPFSDYGVADLHIGCSASATPYSRSPNMSPSPFRRMRGSVGGERGDLMHFSFEQIRSRSSLSNHASNNVQESYIQNKSETLNYHQRILATTNTIIQPRSLDLDARERSRSEGEALSLNVGKRNKLSGNFEENDDDEEEDERMDTGHGHSTLSVPTGITGINEPPPSPTLTELFQPGDLDNTRRKQVEEWIRQQTAALEAIRNSLVPTQQESNLLQVPSILPQNSLEQLWPQPKAECSQVGPMLASLWRRSRSESELSGGRGGKTISPFIDESSSNFDHQNNSSNNKLIVEANNKNISTDLTISNRRRQSQPQAPLLVPLNEATHVCEHCGQGFSMHDRLAKHIASRHRDRSASANDEGNRVHKCQLCPKSFGRSDMLTRHMRLHTGLKPYACQLCGQVFSRSDHLSTHQRTHTGEKPYRCPQCSYAASRRDMITRHMRTHLLVTAEASSTTNTITNTIVDNELQIPPINQLTISPPPPPSSLPSPPQLILPKSQQIISNNNLLLPKTTTIQQQHKINNLNNFICGRYSPPPILNQNIFTGYSSLIQQQQQSSSSSSISNNNNNNNLNTHLAKLFSAAININNNNSSTEGINNSTNLLNSSSLLLAAQQLPVNLCKSSPNLFMLQEYPSAFKPPTINTSNINPSTIAAVVKVQQLIQQQQQTNNGGGGSSSNDLPLLFRQHSFDGGFNNNQQFR